MANLRNSGRAEFAEMTGRAGELIVAGQIMLRGMNVQVPYVDKGIDLIADNGCKVQVKTAHLRMTQSILKIYPEGVYSFHFPKKRYMARGVNNTYTVDRPRFEKLCDVVVLYGVEQNRFWIVPSRLLLDKQCIFMGPSNARAFDKDLAEMQAMVEMGFSQAAIGEKFGIGQASVGRRLERVGIPKHPDSAVVKIRDCENKWEHIIDFSSTPVDVDVETRKET